MLMYPDADVPVVQLSLQEGLDPATHLAIGRALAPLRDEGVLIIGGGMSYHNLRELLSGGTRGDDASERFDTWLTQAVEASDPAARDQKLAHWSEAPGALACHPRSEHLLPLMVAAGAAGDDRGRAHLQRPHLGQGRVRLPVRVAPGLNTNFSAALGADEAFTVPPA